MLGKAHRLTYLWRGTEKDFCYLYIALGAIVEARFTGIQQYLAVPFTPSTEEARKKNLQSRGCVAVHRLQLGQILGGTLRAPSAAFPNTENKP